jgi:hypothetical protein
MQADEEVLEARNAASNRSNSGIAEQVGWTANASGFYSRCAQFEYREGHWQSWLMFLVDFLSSSRQILG